MHEIPQPPRALGVEIREELQDIILRCLEKDPAKRPQKAGQVAEALRRHRASLGSEEFRSGEYSTGFIEGAGARLPALVRA